MSASVPHRGAGLQIFPARLFYFFWNFVLAISILAGRFLFMIWGASARVGAHAGIPKTGALQTWPRS
jgi:hypothetical protein